MNTVDEGKIDAAEIHDMLERYSGTVTVQDRRFPHDASPFSYRSKSPGFMKLDPDEARHFIDTEVLETDADLALSIHENGDTYRVTAEISVDELEEQWYGGAWKRYWEKKGREVQDEHMLYKLELDADDIREPGEPPVFEGEVIYV